MTGKPNRAIGLKWELLEIGHAVDAARILLGECSADQRGEGDPIVKDATRAAAAVHTLVEARTRLLRMVVGEEVDAKLLLGRHNALEDPLDDDEEDVRLSAWDVAAVKAR